MEFNSDKSTFLENSEETAVQAFQRPKVDALIFKQHMQLRPWISLSVTLLIYAAVFALIAVVAMSPSGWVKVMVGALAFIVIAALQNHLLILLHEGAHGLISKNKLFNDLWSDVFFALPLFTTTKTYKAFHLKHHQYSGEVGLDPEIELYEKQDYHYEPRSMMKILKMFARDLCGINLIKFMSSMNKSAPSKQFRELLTALILWGAVLTLVHVSGVWPEFLILWILPQLTLTFFLLKLHGYGEHTGAVGPTEFERTWVHDYNWMTQFFIYPLRSGLHLEHHLYPTIPWYQLNSFRAYLMTLPQFQSRSAPVTSKGYFWGHNSILQNLWDGP